MKAMTILDWLKNRGYSVTKTDAGWALEPQPDDVTLKAIENFRDLLVYELTGDPRPDLKEDHARWAGVLEAAKARQPAIYAELHLMRCWGARLDSDMTIYGFDAAKMEKEIGEKLNPNMKEYVSSMAKYIQREY